MKLNSFFVMKKNKKIEKEIQQKYLGLKGIEFQIEWISKMSFGNAEGEKDKKLNDSFFETRSIKNLSGGDFNYVLAPKGCGKSSLFKAYAERFIDSHDIKDEEKIIIIPISSVFSYEKIDLDSKKIAKELAMIWGIYIIKEIFKVLTSDKYKNSFSEYLKKIKKYSELKEEFELNNLWDYIEKVNVSLKFAVKGQEIAFTPTITSDKKTRKISLNEVFSELQDFLQENKKVIYILIDRVDDFILGENKEYKKAFIQGIYYAIEEISNCSCIVPILFLRTDLYYNLNIDSGIDKIQIRTIELKWRKEELIIFMFKRLFGNSPELVQFYKMFMDLYLSNTAYEAFKIVRRKDINKLVNRDTSLIAEIAEKFIYTFFPNVVKHLNSELIEEEMDFLEWVYKHFEDYTGYINLRYLIVFFNTLFNTQFEAYQKNVGIKYAIKCAEKEDGLSYPIFSDACINSSYHYVQKLAVSNIKSLLELESQKFCFDGIHQMVMQKNGSMNYGDIHYSKYDLSKDEYEELLESLVVLGYFKNSGKKYSIPILYRYLES